MADLDDAFLELVGGDESEDEASEQEINMSQPASDSESESRQKSRKGSSAKKTKRRQGDSDEEEGEALTAPLTMPLKYSSDAESAASQESAPMDESDSEAGTPAPNANGGVVDDDDKYPYEGMFESAQEKEDIMSMREVERESILAERAQEIERQRQNRLLRQLVSAGDNKKRKANDAELEDNQRKTSRQRTKIGGSKVGETSAGIESLRRARAEKSERQRRLADDRERNKKSTHTSRDSPDRDDAESDVEWGESQRRRSRTRTPEVKEIPLSDLRDIERVRLGRSRFAQICFFPGFEDAITGCFTRISIGPDPRAGDGQNQYRMAVIKRFTTGKPYAMEKANGQAFVTDQYVVAAHGKAEREWPFIACSDSPFTEAEFNRYKATLQHESLILPKRPNLVAKIDDINNLRNRSWTDHELDEKLQRERALRKKFAPSERERLAKSLEEAKARGDDDKVSELQDQLDSMETSRLAWKTSLTPAKKASSAGVSQQDRLAQLNMENRRRNVEAVRKAQLKEKAKTREAEVRFRGEEAGDDTSRRLRTQPKFMRDESGPPTGERKGTPLNGSAPSTPTNGTPKLGAVPPHIAKLQQQNSAGADKKGIPQIHRPLMDDDIIGSLDLDIDVEID
ncbi:RNA polymerase-associated protein RTF1 [Seiridium cupressi]